MPVVDADRNADLPQLQAEPGTLSGPIIGIIYPPPEVRSILNLKNICFANVFLLPKDNHYNNIDFISN